WHAPYSRVGQRRQQLGAVVAQQRAAVEEHDGAPVRAGSNEAAEALAQSQRGLWKVELAERILVALRASLHERVIGHEERQPRDDHALEDLARQVDALPERLRAEKN